jgi:thioredoxin 1
MASINIHMDNFESEVLRSDKKVLLDIWAPWCGPCRMIAPFLEEIGSERADVKIGKINVDEQPELAAEFNVMSIPMLVVIENGRIVNRSVGAKPKSAILAML